MRASDIRVTLTVVVLLALGACSGVIRKPELRDGAPPHRADIGLIPDPEPRAEPPSPGGNTSPYTVMGRTYHVLASAEGYRARGIASWYGSKFHGRATANGEVYDAYAMTAAHRTLPLPTYLRVTNLDNGRKVVVRVNDRGPFREDRIIDLSYAAAYKLGFQETGTARVELEAVGEEPSKQVVKIDESKSSGELNGILLQAGAFRSLAGAERLRAALSMLLETDVFIDRTEGDLAPWYRVRIGPIHDPERVANLRRLVTEASFAMPVVVGTPGQ